MSRMVATRLFYSFQGLDGKGVTVSHGAGVLEVKELEKEVIQHILEMAKEKNSRVESIQVLSLVPLEFISLEG